jgi:hypothetical protein
MTSDRPYRSGWPPDRVVAMIKGLRGTHLNSRVVDIFLKTVATHPVGTCIKMLSWPNEGFEGVVVDVDDHKIDRPQIRLLTDTSGERVEPINIDLREEEDLRSCRYVMANTTWNPWGVRKRPRKRKWKISIKKTNSQIASSLISSSVDLGNESAPIASPILLHRIITFQNILNDFTQTSSFIAPAR